MNHPGLPRFFTTASAKHFLRVTLVSSMEGVLFAAVSILFTVAGWYGGLEDFVGRAGNSEMTAAVVTRPADIPLDVQMLAVATRTLPMVP